MSRASNILFSVALAGDEAEPLRTRLGREFRLAGPCEIAVHTFFELFDQLAELAGDEMPRRPSRFLIFDLQRVIAFHDCGLPNEPSISSLVRFLLDGYPLQPLDGLAAAERGRPYRPGFDFAVLELIARCVIELDPGNYGVFDFSTGELLRSRLRNHPQAVPPRICAPHEKPQGSPFRSVITDRTLRSSSPPVLDELIERAAGIIRTDSTGWNFTSLASATTAVSRNRGASKEFCSGAGLSRREAQSVARCEAIERFQVAKQAPGAELVRGSYVDLAEYAVDPADLFFGRSPECPDDRMIPFDPKLPISWTWAWGPAERRWRLVPAQDIWFNTAVLLSEPRFVHPTTNGCAVGATIEEASVFAVLEAIERDGLLTSWYLRRPATEIDFDSFDREDLRTLLGRFQLAFSGYRPTLFDLTSDIGIPTVGGFAVREKGDGPRVLIAAAADIDPQKACLRALKELGRFRPTMTPERVAQLRERLADPASIVGVEGHWEYYTLDDHFDAFAYLELGLRDRIAVGDIGAACPIPPDEQLDLEVVLRLIDQRLHDVGAALYIKDITHRRLESCGLQAARAITPGLYPIWYGALYRRFAITDRLKRLAEAYTDLPFDRARLELGPQPMH